MSTDLGLDPSDPLNLLLHNNSQDGDSSTDESTQGITEDWSKFSALWADNADSMKPYSDIMDFSDMSSMPLDMDFNPSMAIEPSALHYDPTKLNLNFTYDDSFSSFSGDMLSTQFPYTFQSALSVGSDFSGSSEASPQSSNRERRLSITSSSSSSGASLSPVPESIPSPAPGYTSDTVQPKEESIPPVEMNPYANDPAAELAHRVRQSAGVLLAVPMGASTQGYVLNQQQQAAILAQASQGKLPIPRLQTHDSGSGPKSSASSSSSAASTPPPSTPPPSTTGNPLKLFINPNIVPADASNVPTPTSAVPAAVLPRPKTSHTTIERRYRTNLNARIQSLRMAVPALRVLEDREGGNGKKIKKNVKGGVPVKGAGVGIDTTSEDGTVIDVIDERGFVDGVKVARKCSKANVLGKAVEYIRVLKKREMRLKREQSGLKTLIAGLVGGPALVREWEKEWRANFGGEEKDEVEGEGGEDEGDDEDSDGEDGEGDEDEETGRKRKRAKVASLSSGGKKGADKEKKKPAASPVHTSSDQAGNPAPEKRKRGRPRKVLPPPVTVLPVAGAVLQQAPAEAMVQDAVMHPPHSIVYPTNDDLLQRWGQPQQQPQPQQYLLAVFALFSFFNSPLTSTSYSSSRGHQHTGHVLNTLHPPLAYAPDIVAQFAPPSASVVTGGWAWGEYVQVFHLLVSLLVLASFVGSWLGLSFGFGVGSKLVRSGRSMSAIVKSQEPRRGGKTDWVSVGEKSVLQGKMTSLSLYERIQIYRALSSQSSSVGDSTTLAMVVWDTPGFVGRLGRMKASAIWDTAKDKASKSKLSERLVLESMDVSEAVELLSSTASGRSQDSESEKIRSPIEVLGALLVKERLKKHLARMFVNAVEHRVESEVKEKREETERRQTIDAARELGGRVEELGRVFERVWKIDSVDEDVPVYPQANDADDEEINALLTALVLYRRVFAQTHPPAADRALECSTLLSPPPSPTPTPRANSKFRERRHESLRTLRKVLGSRVFELEDAGGAQEEEEMEADVAGEGECVLGLEDARDRVVDMIVEVERRERGASPSVLS